MFIKVDLPEPEAPVTAINSPRWIVEVDAAQSSNLDIAHFICLVQVTYSDYLESIDVQTGVIQMELMDCGCSAVSEAKRISSA